MSFSLLEVGGLLRFLRYSGKNLIMPFYAVVRGRVPGIYDSWDSCKANTEGYHKAIFKSFKTEDEAVDFCMSNGVNVRHIMKGASSPDSVEIMESDDDNQFDALSWQSTSPAVTKPVSKHNSFDFASFSQRLTNLENTYKEKVKQLEERIEALEAARLLSGSTDNDFSLDFGLSADSKPSRSAASTKRTSSKADLLDNALYKKPKTSQNIKVISNDDNTYEFDTDGDGFVKVYTDGACSKNGRLNSKAGVGVWFGENHCLNISEPVQGRATNNMAEIQAGTWAIQQGIRVGKALWIINISFGMLAIQQGISVGVKKICVFTDSQFLINCITKWIKKWKKNGWKTATGDVINRKELEVLDQVVNYPGLNVKWNYVKGHSGDKGNEGADFLARQGAARYKSSNTTSSHPWQQYFAT